MGFWTMSWKDYISCLKTPTKLLSMSECIFWRLTLRREEKGNTNFSSSFLFSLIVKKPNRLPRCPLKLLYLTHWPMRARVIEFALTIQKPEFRISFNAIPRLECSVFLWHHRTMIFDTWVFSCKIIVYFHYHWYLSFQFFIQPLANHFHPSRVQIMNWAFFRYYNFF